jgi:hypothetical protein
MSRIRWKIAGLLNRLPWFCWADLVSWALNGKVKPLPEYVSNARECQSEGETSNCWCAKFCTAEFRTEHLMPRESVPEGER